MQTLGFLQSVLDSAGDGIIVADENGKFLFWNAAAEQLVGLGPQDVPPTEWAAVFGVFLPDGTTPYPTGDLPLVRAIRGQSVNGQELLVRNARFPTGIWLSVSARPFNDAENKLCGGIIVFHDITERKRAEDELKRQKEIFQAIFDHIPLMIRFTDSASQIQLVNRHWEDVMGWTLEEAQKQDIWAEFYPDPADRQRMLEFSRQSTGNWADFKVRVRDGRIRDICWVSVRLSDDVRIAIGQDVTDRKQEERTRVAYASRLQALSRRLVEVQEEERRHLARELHDEIGQMLTGLELLLARNGDLPTDAIRVRGKQAREIVHEVLTRIRELSIDLRPAALDHLGLAAALLTLFEHYTNQTKVVVDFKHCLPDERFAPEVETTAYRIVQEALTNVARHAGVKDVSVRAWRTADVWACKSKTEVAVSIPKSPRRRSVQADCSGWPNASSC